MSQSCIYIFLENRYPTGLTHSEAPTFRSSKVSNSGNFVFRNSECENYTEKFAKKAVLWYFYHVAFLPSGIFTIWHFFPMALLLITNGIFTIWHFYHWLFFPMAFLPLVFLPFDIFTTDIITVWHIYHWHFYLLAFLPMVFLPMAILPMAFLPMAFLPHAS